MLSLSSEHLTGLLTLTDPDPPQLPHRRDQNQDPVRPSFLPSRLAVTTATSASLCVDIVDSRRDVARIGLERLCRRIGADVAQERAGQHGAYQVCGRGRLSRCWLACRSFRPFQTISKID